MKRWVQCEKCFRERKMLYAVSNYCRNLLLLSLRPPAATTLLGRAPWAEGLDGWDGLHGISGLSRPSEVYVLFPVAKMLFSSFWEGLRSGSSISTPLGLLGSVRRASLRSSRSNFSRLWSGLRAVVLLVVLESGFLLATINQSINQSLPFSSVAYQLHSV